MSIFNYTFLSENLYFFCLACGSKQGSVGVLKGKKIKNKNNIIILLSFLMTLCVTLDMGIVNIALPIISQDLNVSMSILSWIVMIFLIPFTACILIFGKLIDIHGIRKVIIPGFFIFLTGLILASLSSTIWILIIARCIQGIGGSILLVGGPSLLKVSLPEEEQARGFGLLSTASALGFLLGPSLGGFIMDYGNWRNIFWIQVIPVFICAIIMFIKVPSYRKISDNSINPVLAALLFGSVFSFIFALNQGREMGWTSPQILCFLGISVILMYLFVFINRKAKDPFLDTSLFKSKEFRNGTFVGFLMKLCEGGPLFFLPFYFIIVQNLDLRMTSVAILIVPIIVSVCGALYGKISSYFSFVTFMIIGTCFLFFSFIGFSYFQTPIFFFVLVGLMVFRGFGIGLFYPPNRTLVISTVPDSKEGIGSAYLRLFELLGYIVSIAVFETIFSEITPAEEISLLTVAQTAPDGCITQAFESIFVLGAVITVIIILILYVVQRENAGHNHREGKKCIR